MKAKHLLSSLLLTAIVTPLFAQTTIGRMKVDQYPVTAAGALTYGLTWVPPDYNPANKYPLIIFMHGSGEGGDGVAGLNTLLNQGLPWWIARGFSPSAVNPVDGKNYEFIVVSPQAPASWKWSYQYTEIQYILPDVLNRYSIDQSRIYITGLSAGGSGTWSCVTDDPVFARRIAAIMPNSDAGLNNTPVEGPFLKDITSVYGVPVWCVDGALDGLNGHTTIYLDTINAGPPVANPQAVQTLIAGAGHSAAAWDSAYSPTWRTNQFGQTAYEWMLRYKRTSASTALTANAGSAQAITLPVSSVTLSGSGSPSSGNTISSYAWTEISGPSAATIGAAGSASTGVSGLAQGIYTFQLTVKDNTGATATSTVAITVKIPTVNAGVSQTITLPTSSVTLAGTAVGNGATILSTAWTQTSGPNTATIVTPAAVSTSVTGLAAGTYVFKLTLGITGLAALTSAVTVTVNASSANLSPGSTTYTPIPGIIQAENYSSMSGVQTESTTDSGDGLDVGWIDQGDWMNYNVNPAKSGTYTLSFRIATPNANAILQLRNAAGTVLATLPLPVTGGWQTWQTVTASISLPAGNQTLQVYDNGTASWNVNWMDFESVASSGQPIPGIIQGENYTSMSGVQTQSTTDNQGGLNVDYIDPADWMDYNVDVAAAGTYTVGFRIATPNSNAVLQLRNAAGAVLATLAVPVTGGWQTWQTITVPISLPAGNQTLQVYSSGSALWNFNWMDFENASSSGNPIPGIVQAENYASMFGVQTENTLDAGEGLDVGWIDPGDWMDYDVNVAAAGTYTVGFRIASPYSNGALQVRNAAGAVLATINIPLTGTWQTWQTVTAAISLPAGSQTLQVYSSGATFWNFNWMDFEASSQTAQAQTILAQYAQALPADLTGSTAPSLVLYPNPAHDNFMLAINNSHTGKMLVQVINQSGQINKTYNLNKEGQSSTTSLNVGDLPPGVYSIRIEIGGWHAIERLLKL